MRRLLAVGLRRANPIGAGRVAVDRSALRVGGAGSPSR